MVGDGDGRQGTPVWVGQGVGGRDVDGCGWVMGEERCGFDCHSDHCEAWVAKVQTLFSRNRTRALGEKQNSKTVHRL